MRGKIGSIGLRLLGCNAVETRSHDDEPTLVRVPQSFGDDGLGIEFQDGSDEHICMVSVAVLV